MKLFVAVLVVVISVMLASQKVHAGPYADALSRCLIESTSRDDRTDLVRWLFSAASKHPAVKPISNVSDAQLDAANKTIADLVTRLLTDSCRAQTKEAIQYEGTSTLETSFRLLGEVAGQELFSSPRGCSWNGRSRSAHG